MREEGGPLSKDQRREEVRREKEEGGEELPERSERERERGREG